MAHVAPVPEGLAHKLNALWGTRWLFNRRPLTATVLAIVVSPVVMWFNDYTIVWGRVLPLGYQWVSALCDAFLAVGIGAMIWNFGGVKVQELPRLWQQLLRCRGFHVGLLASGYILSLSHVYNERGSVTTWDRRTGPNGLYHTLFVFPFLGYVFCLLLFATIGVFLGKVTWQRCAWTWAALAVALTAAFVWELGGVYDGQHQKAPSGYSKHEYSNPPNPYCEGAITVHLCGPAAGRAPIK